MGDWESARSSPRRGRRRVAVLAVVLAVAATAGAQALREQSRAPDLRIERPPDEAQLATTEPAWPRPQPGLWRTMPEAPLTPRTAHAMVRAGAVVFVWGGVDATGRPLTDGGIFDPAAGTWELLPPFAGSEDGGFRVTSTDVDVALVSARSTHRWDPFRNAWVARPPPPLPPGHRLGEHVVGSFGAVVVVSRPASTHPDADSAVFALRRDDVAWRRLPAVPERISAADAVSAGDGRVTIVTRPQEGRPASVLTRPLADDEAPWTRVDPPPGSGRWRPVRPLAAIVSDRTMLVGLGGPGPPAPAAIRDWWRWRRAPPPPLRLSRDVDALDVGDGLVVWNRSTGVGARLDLRTRRWTRFSRSPVADGAPRPAVWTGSSIVTWGGFDQAGAVYRVR